MGTAGKLNDNANVTTPVKSFYPNDYKYLQYVLKRK